MIGGCGGETRGGSSPPFGTIAMDEEFRLGESARTANPVQTTRFLGVKKGEIGGGGMPVGNRASIRCWFNP